MGSKGHSITLLDRLLHLSDGLHYFGSSKVLQVLAYSCTHRQTRIRLYTNPKVAAWDHWATKGRCLHHEAVYRGWRLGPRETLPRGTRGHVTCCAVACYALQADSEENEAAIEYLQVSNLLLSNQTGIRLQGLIHAWCGPKVRRKVIRLLGA